MQGWSINFSPLKLRLLSKRSDPASHKWRCHAAMKNGEADRLACTRILIGAGGTGGHVYPAIAIADAIRATNENAVVKFAGTEKRIEWDAIPAAGYLISAVNAVSLRRPLISIANMLLPLYLLVSITRCMILVSTFKPSVVIGTGGYVSFPTCLAAWLLGCPIAITEQNAHPGIANKVLGYFSNAIFISFLGASKQFKKSKCLLIGNPVRSKLLKSHEKQESLSHFFQNHDKILGKSVVLAVLGGSLGAQKINSIMASSSWKLLENRKNLWIIWQTGEKNFKSLVNKVNPHPRLLILPYIQDMHLLYCSSDLVAGRSGAITCSELLVTGTPSILIPSPNVAEDHQTVNAKSMVEIGASVLLEEKDLSTESFIKAVEQLIGDENALAEMKKKAKLAGKPEAAVDIAKEVLKLANSERKISAGPFVLAVVLAAGLLVLWAILGLVKSAIFLLLR